MTVAKAIKTAMGRNSLSQRQLAEELGYSSQSCISTPLSRKEGQGMKVETLVKWVEAMGFQLAILTDDDEIIVDNDFDEED